MLLTLALQMRQAVELAQGDSVTPIAYPSNGTIVHHPVGCNRLLIRKPEHPLQRRGDHAT